jgi:hypothetical protein
VVEEAPVLDRHDRLLHDRRDVVGLDDHAVLAAAQDREVAVALEVEDVAVLLARDLPRGVEPRDLLRDRGHEAEPE